MRTFAKLFEDADGDKPVFRFKHTPGDPESELNLHQTREMIRAHNAKNPHDRKAVFLNQDGDVHVYRPSNVHSKGFRDAQNHFDHVMNHLDKVHELTKPGGALHEHVTRMGGDHSLLEGLHQHLTHAIGAHEDLEYSTFAHHEMEREETYDRLGKDVT